MKKGRFIRGGNLGKLAIEVSGPGAYKVLREAMLKPGPSKFAGPGLPNYKTTKMENIDLSHQSQKEEENGREEI